LASNFSVSWLSYINEDFHRAQASPEEMDALWAEGFRHFGTYFFRYNLGFYDRELRGVFPLRIRLADFSFSKSQRRVLRRNRDLRAIIRPASIDEEKHQLFARHKTRFRENAPNSIEDFLSPTPARVPCEGLEAAVYENEKLVAVSFFDVGAESLSSVYAMFEPSITARSLGIFTLLVEINHAVERGKKFFYLGYAYEGNSFYDYKKRFRATEMYDWNSGWKDFEE
jgi:leucyl-tRNA---protein transferase